jgi:hypothetical protein
MMKEQISARALNDVALKIRDAVAHLQKVERMQSRD